MLLVPPVLEAWDKTVDSQLIFLETEIALRISDGST